MPDFVSFSWIHAVDVLRFHRGSLCRVIRSAEENGTAFEAASGYLAKTDRGTEVIARHDQTKPKEDLPRFRHTLHAAKRSPAEPEPIPAL